MEKTVSSSTPWTTRKDVGRRADQKVTLPLDALELRMESQKVSKVSTKTVEKEGKTTSTSSSFEKPEALPESTDQPAGGDEGPH